MPRATPAVSCDLLDLACACAATRRAARAVTQLYDGHLRAHGIEAAQFALLSAIAGMGPCSQVHLGRALGVDKTTLSRNVRVLARAGWIATTEPARSRDGRLRVTAAGRRVLVAARPAWLAAQAAMQAAMTPAQWRAMHDTLRLLTEAARRAVATRRRRTAVPVP